ncbi:unnamed protein product [Polarella glacialis]|uniref:Uncharacterized protein n=1 Tax=Polarella glacialis TaxID=89957 RepID=A0A813F1M9_POLGL|nr:unnamed protein product [Polarella glacialis]
MDVMSALASFAFAELDLCKVQFRRACRSHIGGEGWMMCAAPDLEALRRQPRRRARIRCSSPAVRAQPCRWPMAVPPSEMLLLRPALPSASWKDTAATVSL